MQWSRPYSIPTRSRRESVLSAVRGYHDGDQEMGALTSILGAEAQVQFGG